MGFLNTDIQQRGEVQGGLIDIGKKSASYTENQNADLYANLDLYTYSPQDTRTYSPSYNYNPQYVISSPNASISSFFKPTTTTSPTLTASPTATLTPKIQQAQDTQPPSQSGGFLGQLTDNATGIAIILGLGYIAIKAFSKKK